MGFHCIYFTLSLKSWLFIFTSLNKYSRNRVTPTLNLLRFSDMHLFCYTQHRLVLLFAGGSVCEVSTLNAEVDLSVFRNLTL